MPDFEQLLAWQRAHQLVLHVYGLTKTWPASEKFCLIPQIRRAAISIPANIAEGAAKHGAREFRRYLNIALGSRSEVKYMLRLAKDLGYLDPASSDSVASECDELGRLLWGLYRSIKPPV
jgi:four helix bundle protein